MSVSSSILAKMAVMISANTAEFNKALSDTNNRLNSFEKNFLKLGQTIAAGIGFQKLADGIISAVDSMAQFSHKMSEVKAITGAAGADFDALRNNALSLAGAFKSIDIAKLEIEFGRLGFATEEILQSTKATIQLATATGEDLAKSAGIAGSTLRSFNLDASQMGRVVDVMAAGFNKSALSLDNFGEAIKYVAPVAAAAGISLEQVTAMLGVLADNGIRGSMAGTSLRKIISDLGQGAGPILTQELKKMAEAGISGAAAMDEVGRTAYASLLVLANNTEKVKEAEAAYNSANGEVAKMAAIMQDDLVGDMQKFNAAIDQTIQKGGVLEPLFRSLTQSATKFIHAISFNEQALALDNLQQRIRGIGDLLSNPHYSESAKVSVFKQMEKEAAAAGVKLQDLMVNYELVKKTLFGGGNYNPPKPDTLQLAPFIDPNKRKGEYGEAASVKAGKADMSWNNPDFFNGAYLGKDLDEFIKKMKQVDTAYQDLFGAQDQLDDEYNNFHEEVSPQVQATIDKITAKYNMLKSTTVDLGLSTRQIGRMMRQELVSITVSFGQMIGNVLSGMSGFDLGNMLLGQLGRVCTQLGEMLIAVGLGVEAFKASLKSLNGPVAIAAGIALVAAGTLFTNTASAAAQGGGGGASAGVARVADTYRDTPPIRVEGEFKLRGPEMIAAIQQQGYIMGRTG